MRPRAGSQAGEKGDVGTTRSDVTGQPKPRTVRMAIQGNIDPLTQFPSEAVTAPGSSSADPDALQNDAIAAIERFDDIAGQMAAWLEQASMVRDQLQRHLVRQDAGSQPQELSRNIRPWRSGWERIGPSTRVVGGVALLALLSLRAAGSSNPPAQDAIAAPVELAEEAAIVAPASRPAVVAAPAALIQVSTEASSTAPSKPPSKALSTAPSKVQVAPLPEPERPREYFGTLAVMSDPIGARVLIDGKYVGETPVEVPKVRAGSHVVWIEAAGFMRWTGALPVPADRRTAIHPKLQPERDR